MSDSDGDPCCTSQHQTQKGTASKRARARIIDDSDDDNGAPTPPPAQRFSSVLPASPSSQQMAAPANWGDKVLFKGRSARSAIGRRVSVIYINDGRREAFLGKVVNASPHQGLRVVFESDGAEEWVNSDEGDEWEWHHDGAEAGPSSAGAGLAAAADGQSEVHEVERILQQRTARGVTEYLVKWKGYANSANTWEPEAELVHLEAFGAFKRLQGKKPIGTAAEPISLSSDEEKEKEEEEDDEEEEEEESSDDDDEDSDAESDQEDADEADKEEVEAACASASTARAFSVGQRVSAMFQATEHGSAKSPGWFVGKVARARKDGKFDIEYDDGDKESRVDPKFIKPIRRLPAPRGGGNDDDDDDDEDGGGAERRRGEGEGSSFEPLEPRHVGEQVRGANATPPRSGGLRCKQ